MNEETVWGSSSDSIEDAIKVAIEASNRSENHLAGEVVTLAIDHGGFRGGTEYRVEVLFRFE